MPKVMTVQVNLNAATGEIDCNPEPVEVEIGDTVQWTSNQGDVFGRMIDRSPLDISVWLCKKVQLSDPRIVNGPVGFYKYSISLVMGSTIHTKDPVIHVH